MNSFDEIIKFIDAKKLASAFANKCNFAFHILKYSIKESMRKYSKMVQNLVF